MPPAESSVYSDPLCMCTADGPSIAAQVSEQVLKAFGIETCGGLIANRGLLAALFSPVSVNFFMAAALGIGRTQHGEPVEEGAIGRKGISNERTFQAMSAPAELEAKARSSVDHSLVTPVVCQHVPHLA